MGFKDSQLVLLPVDKLENLLNPVLVRLDSIEKNLNKNSNKGKVDYYRNKDLKEKFGLSPNTIIKYRDLGIIPFTMIGELYLYPVLQFDAILKSNSNWDLFQSKSQ